MKQWTSLSGGVKLRAHDLEFKFNLNMCMLFVCKGEAGASGIPGADGRAGHPVSRQHTRMVVALSNAPAAAVVSQLHLNSLTLPI